MKIRADQLLVERGIFESRARAQAAIVAGLVTADGAVVRKASAMLASDAQVTAEAPHPYVSRGGLKLAAALDAFGFDPKGRICLDVGASTGGFTDVLLHRRAAQVFAIDVGTNQLAWKLRQDDRVVVLEKTNARNLTSAEIPEPVDLIVCDASFIGLAKVLDRAISFAKPKARMVTLIKPQFEAGRDEVGKGGVVRDPAVHDRVCAEAGAWATSKGWQVIGIEKSPITGPEGNVEFLLAAIHGDPA